MSSIKDSKKLSERRNVLKSLFELKVKGTLCDVQLCLRGSTLSAHACVLASCSPYFLQLFQLNQEIHWCSKSPLVINLDNFLPDSKNLCVSCFSKMLDFMYLRELVVGQDHYEHFTEINNLFHVFDFMPLGQNWKKTNLFKPAKIEASPNEQISGKRNEKGTEDSFSDKASQSESVSLPTTQQLSGESEIVGISRNTKANSSLEKVSVSPLSSVVLSSKPPTTNNSSCFAGETLEISSTGNCDSKFPLNTTVCFKPGPNMEDKSYPLQVSTNDAGASVFNSNMNKKNYAKKTCEFMCCNPEPDNNISQAKIRKRRKMLCKLCSFSSVCIKKVLQHLQSTNHLQSPCPVCLRKIHNINDLTDHIKEHANAKPFICHICNKRNRYWDYHKMHLKIHCKNKPFYCDLCQRGFVSKRSLAEHLTTHKGSYLCNKCEYFTSDLNIYKSHLLQHDSKILKHDSGVDLPLDAKPTKPKVRNFKCQVCSEGFTQKKNLARHVKLKHFESALLKCSMCAFSSSRSDILGKHMKRKHNCTLVKERKGCSVRMNPNKNNRKISDIVSFLIPIHLVSDNSTVNAFAIEDNRRQISHEVHTKGIIDDDNSFSDTHVVLCQNPNIEFFADNEVIIDSSKQSKEQNDSFSVGSDFLHGSTKSNRESDCSRASSSMTDSSYNSTSNPEEINKSIHVNLIPKPHSITMDIDSSESKFLSPHAINDADLSIVKDGNTINRKKEILEENKYIWLNETTGELLSDETFVSMKTQKTVCKASQIVSENSTVDLYEKLKSSVLNEASGDCSVFDIRDDNEEWQYPHTPQAGVVGIDDCDNLFPWNQIDNSFYSTWVLNETTGELNMVSFFSIQSIKTPTELELNEKAEALAPLEDDDTALFLNEGTGDLSVIYFNPNGPERSNLKFQSCEKPGTDNLETLSEISDDDSDLLNEEFMRVSANFMSNEENEKFLNELTGEFDVANLSNYQPEVINNYVAGNESYLNEETGEISLNTMDDDMNNDLVKKPDSLEYDLDDSLNCEDFESFFRDVSGFSSQFCLDDTSKNWQSADEASDTLVLNECTGELVKRS